MFNNPRSTLPGLIKSVHQATNKNLVCSNVSEQLFFIFRVNMATRRKQVETVTVKTFNSWDFHKDFRIIDNGGKITHLQWNVCSCHLTDIRREARNRGFSGKVLYSVIALSLGFVNDLIGMLLFLLYFW